MFPVFHKHRKFPVTTISICGYKTVLGHMGLRAVLEANTQYCASGFPQTLHGDGGKINSQKINTQKINSQIHEHILLFAAKDCFIVNAV